MHSTPTSRATAARALAAGLFLAFAPSLAFAGFPSVSGNTATLLPDGSVMSVGGSATPLPGGGYTGCGGTGCTVKIDKFGVFSNGPDLPSTNAEDGTANIARSSHTATILPNGSVLVAGGVAGDLTIRKSLLLYNTRTGAWTDTGLSMSARRYAHTATLLKTGAVLLCGGATVVNPGNAAGNVTNSCDLYTPPGILSCGGANGCLSATGSLAAPRALHTASLLPDGRVFFTGGWDGFTGDFNTGVAGALATSEIYTPATGQFGSAHALIEARYNHSATVMADGRVLIAGGFNGRNVANNFGILASAEIYDPNADSMSSAAPMLARNQSFAATLENNGAVVVNGGLGNVTTTFLATTPCTTFASGSKITGTDIGLLNGAFATQITGGSLTCGEKFPLTPDTPTGEIESGFINYSSPTITLHDGLVEFGYGPMDVNTFLPGGAVNSGTVPNATTALFTDLQGTIVFVDPLTGLAGQIDRTTMATAMTFQGYSGNILFEPFSVAPKDATLTGASISFTPSPISSYNGPPNDISDSEAAINGGTFNLNLVIPNIPPEYYSSSVFQGTLQLEGGVIVVTDNTTGNEMAVITLVPPDTLTPAGSITFPANTGSVDASGNLSLTGPVTVTSLSGTVSAATPTITGLSSPITTAGFTLKIKSMTGIVDFNASPVTVDGLPLTLNVVNDTVTIKSMVFADEEIYNEKANSWTYGSQGDSLWGFGAKSVLLPNGTEAVVGGRSCDPALANISCPGRVTTSGANFVEPLTAWTLIGTMLSPRANLTANVLPSGEILLIGGSNGTNVLDSAELFDAGTVGADKLPGPMVMTRDLHTSSLLPNGRVLVAGGFTTTGSTGSTNTAEIYYPGGPTGNGYFLPTASMASARDDHAAVLGADGNPIVIGGYDSNTGQYLKGVEVYFSTAGTWGKLHDLTAPRALFSASVLRDGRVLVAGGINGAGPLNATEIYNPTTNLWTAGNPMPFALYNHRSVMLPDGRVLVSGGDDGFGETQSSLIFDPASGLWSKVGSLSSGRLNHDAVLLPNGVVAVIGGAQALGQSLPSVETFDVFSSSWGTAPSLTAPRANQATVVATNGDIITFGGFSNGVAAATIEGVDVDDNTDSLATNGGATSPRRSTIAAVDLDAFDHVSTITISGLHFRGRTEAGSGGSDNSDFSEPRFVLSSLDSGNGASGQGASGFYLDVTTRVYSTLNSATGGLYNTTNNGANNTGDWSIVDSSISLTMPSDATPLPSGTLPTPGNFLPYGWYQLTENSNSLFSRAFTVHAGPVLPDTAVGTVAPIPNPAASFYASENLPQVPTTWITSSTVHWAWPSINDCAGGQCVGGGFDVYLATNGVFVTTISYSTNVFVQSGLAPNTTVSITVAPYDLSGDGPTSTSISFFTLSTAPITSATSISSVAFAGLQLSWNVNNNQAGTIYEVSESTDDPTGNGQQPFTTSFSTPVPTLLGLTTNFTFITGLVSNTTYFFRVRALNGSGLFSNFSATVSTETRSSVSAPVGTALTSYSIQWTWPDAFIAANAHYNVYNATSGFLIGQVAEPPLGNSPTFIETGLSTNTANSIDLRAATGAGLGPLSADTTVFTLAAVPGPGASITNLSTGSLTAFWTADQNPLNTVYDLVLSNVKPDATVPPGVSTIAVANNSFTGTFNGLLRTNGFPPAQAVAVNVYGVNGDGVLSAPLLLTPLNGGTTSLWAATPGQPAVTGATGNSISITWNSSNNSSSATYEVTYTTDGFVNNISTALFYSQFSNVTSLVVGGLLTGTTYQFRVRSFNELGFWNGSYSAVSAVAATANGGAAPGSLTATVDPTQNVTIVGTLAGQRPFSLFIPANTFAQTVTLTISTAQFNPPSACPGGGPYGLNFIVDPPLEPLHPAFLTLTYTPPDIAGVTNLNQLALERIDSATGRCVPLATTVNQAASQVTATLNHFSLFQLGQVSGSSTVETTLIFPNPFMPTEGNGYVTFSQVPSQAHIQIYTLKGALVTDGYANSSGIYLWGGTNQGGRPVASGIYLAVVRSGDTKKIFKVVVLR